MIITNEEKKALIHWHVERIRWIIDGINFNGYDDTFIDEVDEMMKEISKHRIAIDLLKNGLKKEERNERS